MLITVSVYGTEEAATSTCEPSQSHLLLTSATSVLLLLAIFFIFVLSVVRGSSCSSCGWGDSGLSCVKFTGSWSSWAHSCSCSRQVSSCWQQVFLGTEVTEAGAGGRTWRKLKLMKWNIPSLAQLWTTLYYKLFPFTHYQYNCNYRI